ncbi:MAG: hypothetical protein H6741_16650 [Alphaproteobacteria bacterium]|nr:hypothetical protein [Alphaproteobacteria bacterium]MCB9794345.1 hypothetical protein [Alphaproteobacteria bacterium]
MRRAALLLPLALLGASWADPEARFTLDLGEAWELEAGAPTRLEGEALQAHHLPTGGGFSLRHLPLDEVLLTSRRVQRQHEVEATMSPDRLALLFAKEHEETLGPATLYTGPGEGPTGRWVYRDPEDPGRLWWQVLWRSEAHVHQLVAWGPVDRLEAWTAAMMAVEQGVDLTGYAPPPTLLFDAGRDDCGPPVQVDRRALLQRSARFAQAREQLRGAAEAYDGPLPPRSALRLAELAALDTLFEGVDSCVHAVARQRRACQVVEGPPDEAFAAAVQSCVDGTPDLGPLVEAAMARALESP